MPKQTDPVVLIQPQSLFHTPQSQEELLAYFERFYGSERLAVLTGAMMTWNYLASQVNGSINEHMNNPINVDDRPWERSLQNPYANIDPEEEES